MNDQVTEAIATMWASHPEAASLSLRWATLEQQLDVAGDVEALEFARTVRSRAAEHMKAKATAEA
jgi:pyridoxine/pyridoxamine 5'-phosphate oxidase